MIGESTKRKNAISHCGLWRFVERQKGFETLDIRLGKAEAFQENALFLGCSASSCIQYLVGFGANWIQSIGY